MIDLGSIAKGYAGQQSAQYLREHGITSALLNLGGNVQTIGSKPDGSPWKIVKKRIEGGANEKAVLRLFINCPFVCINFDFFWLNKARQLYMDF